MAGYIFIWQLREHKSLDVVSLPNIMLQFIFGDPIHNIDKRQSPLTCVNAK